MAFSYSGDPSASALDAVRFLTGDTTEALALLANAEITYLLGVYGSAGVTAPYALEAMLAKCASDTLTSADGITRDLSARRQALTERLAALRRTQHLSSVGPFVGGVSRSERDTRQDDEELLQPAFRRQQFDFVTHDDGTRENERWP